MSKMSFVGAIGIIVLACSPTAPSSVVRHTVMLDRAVMSLNDSVTVKVLVKNEGPDAVRATVPCPSIAVRDMSFPWYVVGPHTPCLDVIPQPFDLPAGDSIVSERIWGTHDLTWGREGLYTIYSVIYTEGTRHSESASIQINRRGRLGVQGTALGQSRPHPDRQGLVG